VSADELEAAMPVLLRLGWAVRAFQAARHGCAESLRVAREALESWGS
jgi:homoserine kinase type II